MTRILRPDTAPEVRRRLIPRRCLTKRVWLTHLVIALLGLSAVAATESMNADAEIRAVLDAQAQAWNRGDVDAFMEGYWKSEKTEFVGSEGVFRGWQAVLERYRKAYPGRQAMGRLTFSSLEITPLAPDAALVLGDWQLEREHDRPGGVFTLVFRKFPEGWRIIHDHTSVVTAENQ